MPSITQSSKQALAHLKRLKPYDGWSLEAHSSTKEVRLLRRKIPLTDNYFRDIHYDSVSGNVVGILVQGPPTKGQVLVDSTGRPHGKTIAIAYVTTWKPGVASSTRSAAATERAQQQPTTTESPLSDEQNRELLKYAAGAIGGALALRVLLSAFFMLYILLLPAVYLYAVQTVPSPESFDAKKELKRIMRGHHLPEEHVDKPKGWLNETLARVQATVTTELATGLGYEVSMTSYASAVNVTTVAVPAVNKGYVWVGAFGKWRYIYHTELEANPQVST